MSPRPPARLYQDGWGAAYVCESVCVRVRGGEDLGGCSLLERGFGHPRGRFQDVRWGTLAPTGRQPSWIITGTTSVGHRQCDRHTAPRSPTSLEPQSRNAWPPRPGPPRVPAPLDWDPFPGHTKAQAKFILPSPLGDPLGPGYSGTTGPQVPEASRPQCPLDLGKA